MTEKSIVLNVKARAGSVVIGAMGQVMKIAPRVADVVDRSVSLVPVLVERFVRVAMVPGQIHGMVNVYGVGGVDMLIARHAMALGLMSVSPAMDLATRNVLGVGGEGIKIVMSAMGVLPLNVNVVPEMVNYVLPVPNVMAMDK